MHSMQVMTATNKSKWAIYVGLIALGIALLVAWPYYRSRHGTGISPLGNPPVGTSGHEGAPEAEEPPATLHDLETVTGAVDPHELIGRRVDFHVKVADIANNTSFWVGNKDNRMLVVLGRDNRSDAQRDHGNASPNDIQPVKPGQTARVTGTIEGLPDAEGRFSWGLNDSVRRELKDQKVYIRATNVMPEG